MVDAGVGGDFVGGKNEQQRKTKMAHQMIETLSLSLMKYISVQKSSL
jgi:hypothetical protein